MELLVALLGIAPVAIANAAIAALVDDLLTPCRPVGAGTPIADRLIGSVRRECLDHVVVLGERHLGRILAAYFAYYHQARTHLSLDKDAPDGRPIEPRVLGQVISVPHVGGLHHRYVRRA